FVTHVRNFVTHITNFVIHVTSLVTNFFCADSEKYHGLRKKLLGDSKKYPPQSSWADGYYRQKKQPSTEMLGCDWFGSSTIHT
ncbi:MAG: hypothetical protein ACOCNN_07100, partial [Bacteroidales bacterium]